MTTGDTIAAISSAVGPAARMIVRMSGADALKIARDIADNACDVGGAFKTNFHVSDLTVPATLYVFHAPNSYTGEHLVEFHTPGNPLLVGKLLDALIERGARQADPGEFTARAYFNGRIDLTEAEGVAAAVSAGSERELRAARQLLAGELARRLRPVIELVAETLALVEVGIDFSDEDVTFLSSIDLVARLERADGMLCDLLENSTRFDRLTHEPTVVLVGKPNAGKSTLLNALAGRERAVTSPTAGTTRDVLSVEIALRRGIIKLLDAAGLAETHSRAATDIERQMHDKALLAVESADVIVLVHDATDHCGELPLPRAADVVVRTKSDLRHNPPHLNVSAKSGENLDQFRETLDRLAFGETLAAGPASLSLNARHVRTVSEAREALARAKENANSGEGSEIVALDLRESLDALGGVVGMVTPDELLGRIFSAFCIGK